jgi:hypothetical protein
MASPQIAMKPTPRTLIPLKTAKCHGFAFTNFDCLDGAFK